MRATKKRSNARARDFKLAGAAAVLLAAAALAVASPQNDGDTDDQAQVARPDRSVEARCEELLAQAYAMLDGGDVEAVEHVLEDPVFKSRAKSAKAARALALRVKHSGDPSRLLEVLAHLSSEDFEAFRDGDAVPGALDFGHDVLTARAVEIAKNRVADAEIARIAMCARTEGVPMQFVDPLAAATRCPESCPFRHRDIERLVAALSTSTSRREIGRSVQAVLDSLARREPATPSHLDGPDLMRWGIALRDHNDVEDERAVAAVAKRYGVTNSDARDAHDVYRAARLR